MSKFYKENGYDVSTSGKLYLKKICEHLDDMIVALESKGYNSQDIESILYMAVTNSMLDYKLNKKNKNVGD